MRSHGKEGFPIRNHIILPALAVVAGAAGFAARMWQWHSAYDPELERFLHSAPATWLLLGLLAVQTPVFLLLSRKAAKALAHPLPPRCPQTIYMTLMTAAGFLFLGAGVLGLLEGMTLFQLLEMGESIIPSYPPALLLCGGLCLAGGIATLLVGKEIYRPGRAAPNGAFAVLPALAMVVWLFATHQSHATDPILMRYGVYLAAAIFLMLAHYDMAAFYQGQRHVRRFVFCTLMGVCLAITAMADSLSYFQMAMVTAAALSAIGQCYAVLSPAVNAEVEL